MNRTSPIACTRIMNELCVVFSLTRIELERVKDDLKKAQNVSSELDKCKEELRKALGMIKIYCE